MGLDLAVPIRLFATPKISVAVAERPKIGVRRRRIVTVALKVTEGGRHRALLDAELHDRTIRTQWLRALAGVRDPIVRISKRRIAVSAGLKHFLSERPCRDGGQ